MLLYLLYYAVKKWNKYKVICVGHYAIIRW